MGKIKILVVEDDKGISETLAEMLDLLGHEVVDVADSVDSALQILSHKDVDLALVDIQLTGHKTGIDLGKELSMYHNIPYVFTTAYAGSDIVKEASETNPYGYLIKPYGRKDINAAIEVAISNFKKRQQASLAKPATASDSSIFVRVDSKLVRLNYEDILFVEAKGDYVVFHTEKKNYIVHSTIKNLENFLDPAKFIKVHRSFIINVDKVNDIGDSNLLIGETVIPISRRQKNHLLNNIRLLR